MAIVLLTGCHTAGYYAQAVRGHLQIVHRQQPIAEILQQPPTPEPLKAKLRLVLALREFAAQELKLPVNGHYLRYADLGRSNVVWNVTATPEFSMTPKDWWYPVVGRLAYRGYFVESAARQQAAELAAQGFDVDVGGVRAYSTLGWFRDPVLNTFIHEPETELAELLFHELAHQRLFVSGDTDFNEAFAEAVGEEGTRRWLRAKHEEAGASEYAAYLQRKADFTRLVTGAHDELAALFDAAGTTTKSSREAASLLGGEVAGLRGRKQAILDQLRRDYETLKATWGGHKDYERWFRRPLNNAHLNDVDTYYRLVPAFHRLLREQGGDLGAFYREVETLAKLPKAERHRRLQP
ncbi:MAG: hypothetical protein RL514_4278 [Verrucomicrobiota bacterium]